MLGGVEGGVAREVVGGCAADDPAADYNDVFLVGGHCGEWAMRRVACDVEVW